MGNCAGADAEKTKAKGLNVRDGSSSTQAKNIEYKVVMLGNQAVGKTSIALRYIENKYSDVHKVTIGAQFQRPQIKLKNGGSITLNLWDTTGDEKFSSIIQMYFRDARAAILVYDIGNKETFNKIDHWLQKLFDNVQKENIVLYLVGNKKDLDSEDKQVDKQDAQRFASERGMIFSEASAKTGDGVTDVFQNLAEEIAKKFNQ